MNTWLAAFHREITLLRVQVQHWALPLCFAVAMLILLQFALDESAMMKNVLPRMYSIIILLVMFLIPDYLFKNDWLSGYLPQYALSPIGLGGAMSVRLLVQGLWMGVPLLIVLLLSVMVTGLSLAVATALMLSLVLLLPILFLLAAFAGALTLTLPQTSLLGVLILMPFYCPPLMAAQSMVVHAQAGLPFVSEIYLLIAMAIGAVATLPWLMVVLLRRALG
ncbi:MAG: heme exporter protein CcmB [Gammaproteobacteria bacterium]